MSSALAIVLMAAMAVPGNGPEKVSWEIRETLPLQLYGHWEGRWQDSKGKVYQLRVTDRGLTGSPLSLTIVDDGDGYLHIDMPRGEVALGIGKREGDTVMICYANPGCLRPTTYQTSRDQGLFIFHRVKPGK